MAATDAVRQLDLVDNAVRGAITCLATAGTLVVGTRHEGGTGEALITALRDELTAALEDVQTLRKVLKGERLQAS